MHVRVLLWLDFMFQGSTFISGAYPTFPLPTFLTQCLTHPTARKQDISTCRPFSAGANGSSTRGSLLFLLHRSILLKQDARFPVVHICHHKCLLEVDVVMTQDVTVKRGNVEVLSCTPIKQNFSVPLCHVSCVQGGREVTVHRPMRYLNSI